MSNDIRELLEVDPTTPQESNNQNPVPTSALEYPRDPDYYLHDGGTVFLVDGVLFKLPADLLATKGTNGKKAINFRVDPQDTAKWVPTILLELESGLFGDRPGGCDATPLEIPNLKVRDFRTLLLALIVRPGNSWYTDLVAQSRFGIDVANFMSYVNLMITAFRFDLRDLSLWASQQLQDSVYMAKTFAQTLWDTTTLQNLWIANTMTRGSLRSFFLGAISSLFSSDRSPHLESHPNVNVCVKFYKDRVKWPTHVSSQMFGAILPFILALGPLSSVWKDKLTQTERSDLYIAYAHLVNLETCSSLKVDWIAELRLLYPDSSNQPCDECSSLFTSAWKFTFGSIGRLNSLVPAEDIRKITLLPQYRRDFDSRLLGSFCLKSCRTKTTELIDSTMHTLFFHQIPAAYHAIAS